MNINDTVNTPNGAGIYSGLFAFTIDDNTTEFGILVRHPKGKEIDLNKCAAIISITNITGWLVVYRKEECHEPNP